MHASRSRTRALTVPVRIWIPLTFVALWFALALTWSLASGATPTGKTAASDSTASDGGFRVRVREEGSTSKIEAARRALERAKEEARRTRAEARASRIPVPPEPPDQPDRPDVPEHIKFDTSDNDVVRFGEDITIPEDKVIDGNVVAIGGSVTVLGRVKGDVTAIGGAVHIKGKGVVEGDAVSMGGGVTTSDSGAVAGSNVSLGGFHMGSCPWPMLGLFGAVGTGIWIITSIVKLALTIFFAWLLLLFLGSRMTHAVDVMGQRFGKSFLWGLLGWAAMVVAIPAGIVLLVLVGIIAIAILAITIIGIPLAI
ncbi:MAG TPA: polymer-forming cytoskeletal protein, partial [Candidatus Eisenbacteria bacterium]